MRYQTKPGDSPTRIARAYGIPFDTLINANRHKPTKMVANQRTWRELAPRETINVPVGGRLGDSFGLGDPATDVVNILMAAGGPCLQANAGYVCQIQSILGVTVDGKYGSGTAAALRALVPSAPAGCSPTPAWWAPKGSSKCPSGAAPTASAPPAAGSSLDRAAGAALAALLGDPNYCSSVKKVGSPVNTAIHNFKAAWNSANPTNKVPIGTGNYEPIVQIALALALNTQQTNVPQGCGAAPAVAPSPAPSPVNVNVGPPSPGFVDPCDPANVAQVCALQRALGVTVDGKYGSGTSTAARRADPNAPGPCVPRPAWWKPSGQSNCAGGSPVPTTPFTPSDTVPRPTPVVSQAVVPAPVAALTTINPCDQSSLEVVYAAQRALGVSPDGKYGDNTANAARRILPNAPAACSPRPAWWAPPGQSNLPSGSTVPTPPARPPQPAPTVVVPVPGPAPSSGQPIVVGPAVEEKKGLSTGAIVAGAIGALALVGVVAVAATGKKGSRGSRGKRGSRGPGRRKSSHKKRR